MDKSARIVLDIFYGIIFLTILVSVFFTYKGVDVYSFFNKKYNSESLGTTTLENIKIEKIKEVIVEGRKYKVRDVDYKDTTESRKQGLSSTTDDYLCDDCAMLFVWPGTGVRLMWMKDMSYDIDMYWLDSNMKVLHVEHNIKATSYDAKHTEKSQVYGAEYMAKYVLETKVYK